MTFSSKSVKFQEMLVMGNLTDSGVWWNDEQLSSRVPQASLAWYLSNLQLQISHFQRDCSIFGAFYNLKTRISLALLHLLPNCILAASETQNWRWSWKIQILRPFMPFFDAATMKPSKFEVFGTLSQSISEIYFSIKKNLNLAEFPHLSSLCSSHCV